MLISITLPCTEKKGPASIACQYLILSSPPPSNPIQSTSTSATACVFSSVPVLSAWHGAVSIKERHFVYAAASSRPKSGHPRPAQMKGKKMVGVEKTTNVFNHQSPLKRKEHSKKGPRRDPSSPRPSAHARSGIFPRLNCLISGFRLHVSWLALMIRHRFDFLPSWPSLLVLWFAVALTLRIDARTRRRAVVRIAATFPAAINLDTAAAAGDAVALASALRV